MIEMKTARPIGAGLVVVAALGGCRQLIGYEDPIVVEALCANGKRDGDETGKDCGGSCSACADGEGCKTGADCVSKVCSSGGLCLAPACDDKVGNGGETDTDCGGETCGGCGPGLVCKVDGDCKNKECVGGRCASICTDGLKGGAETDVDCGGGAASGCSTCADGQACKVGGDCDSGVCLAETCASNYVWSTAFLPSSTPGSSIVPSCVASDAMGNVVVGGTFVAPVTLGGPQFPLSGSFVARLDKAGKYVWSTPFGDAKQRAVAGLVVDTTGSVAAVGKFAGTLGFGPITDSAGGLDAFAIMFDAAGTMQWVHKYGDAADQEAAGIALAPGGDLVLGGRFQGAIDFGGGALVSAGHSDVFVTKLTSTGSHVWSKRFGGAGYEFLVAPVVDDSGNVIIGGMFEYDFAIGTTLKGGDGFNAFVAKLDADGNPQWARSFGGIYDDNGTAVAVDAQGNVFFAGTYTGNVDFGGGPVEDQGADSIFLVKLDPSGSFLWSKAFGYAPGRPPSLAGMTVTPSGGIVLTGRLPEATAFGGPPLTSAGSDDVFVAVLDGEGNHLWSRHFGDSNAQAAVGVTHLAGQAYAVAGTFTGSLAFGAQVLNSPGSGGFVAELLLP